MTYTTSWKLARAEYKVLNFVYRNYFVGFILKSSFLSNLMSAQQNKCPDRKFSYVSVCASIQSFRTMLCDKEALTFSHNDHFEKCVLTSANCIDYDARQQSIVVMDTSVYI